MDAGVCVVPNETNPRPGYTVRMHVLFEDHHLIAVHKPAGK